MDDDKISNSIHLKQKDFPRSILIIIQIIISHYLLVLLTFLKLSSYGDKIFCNTCIKYEVLIHNVSINRN